MFSTCLQRCKMLHEFLCISLQGFSDPTVVYGSSCISPLLFCRIIKRSWTACRDCLMITISDWTSSSKNPTSWWMLNKHWRRTINGTGWWEMGWMFRSNHNGCSWPYFACCLQYVLLLGRRPRQSWTICRIWLKTMIISWMLSKQPWSWLQQRSTCRMMGLRAVFFSRCIMMLNGLDRFWWFQLMWGHLWIFLHWFGKCELNLTIFKLQTLRWKVRKAPTRMTMAALSSEAKGMAGQGNWQDVPTNLRMVSKVPSDGVSIWRSPIRHQHQRQQQDWLTNTTSSPTSTTTRTHH